MGGFQGITDGNDRVNVTADSALAVREQQNTAPLVLIPLHKAHLTTTLAADATIDTYTTTLTDVTGVVDGDLLAISDPASQQVYFGNIVGAPVGNVVTVDRPFDFTFSSGAYTTVNKTNLGVDGSGTTQVFGLREGLDSGITFTVDVHRLMLTIYCTSAADLSTFGNLAGGITNGVTIRRRDGNRVNIANLKTNGDIASIAYDMTIFSSTNPQQGQDGVTARLTFTKFGGVVRVSAGEDIEALINDNLSTLTDFKIVVEGIINTEV